jgi:hypothetical protein
MENQTAAVEGDTKKVDVVATPVSESDAGQTTTVVTGNAAKDEYPTGVRLMLIITAICLSIFLASLDMVCELNGTNSSKEERLVDLIWAFRRSFRPLFLRSPMSSTVLSQ